MLASIIQLLLGMMKIQGTAFGAQVVYATSGIVIVDAGTEHGLAKGDDVCLQIPGKTAPTCSPIVAIRGRVAGLKVAPNLGIKKGLAITSKNLTDDGSKKISKKDLKEFIGALSKADTKEASAGTQETPSPPKQDTKASPTQNHRVFFGVLYSPLLPYEHRVPKYDLNKQILRSGSLWASDIQVKSSNYGIQGGIILPVQIPWSLMAGFKYRFPFQDSLDVDYDAAEPSIYSKIATKSGSYGVSIDGVYSSWTNPWVQVMTTGGLDFDKSTVDVKITQEGGSENLNIAVLKSDLLTVSPRLGFVASIPYKKGGISLHSHILLPLFGNAQVTGARQNLKAEVANDQRSSSQKDLEEALGHKRTKFGLELGIHSYYEW